MWEHVSGIDQEIFFISKNGFIKTITFKSTYQYTRPHTHTHKMIGLLGLEIDERSPEWLALQYALDAPAREEKLRQAYWELRSLFNGAIQYGPTSWQYARLQTLFLVYCCPC